MPVIAVANQKGGVGKTTTVVSLASALQSLGKRVLVVDNDPQSNLALSLGIPETDALFPTLGDLLMSGTRSHRGPSIREAIVQTPSGLDLVPSNVQLSAAELVLVAVMGREHVMKSLLAEVVPDYDYVLIDCLPSLGLLAVNALTAADGVLIPVQSDYLAVQGLAQIMETIAAVREKLNPELRILGVLLTMLDPRTSHSREVSALLRNTLGIELRVFESEIRLQVALKDAVRSGLPVQDYNPRSQAAQAYQDLAYEVMGLFGDKPDYDRLAAAGSGAWPVRPQPRVADLGPAASRSAAQEENEPEEALMGSSLADEIAARLLGQGPVAEPSRPSVAAAASGSVAGVPVAVAPGSAEPTRGVPLFRKFLAGREEWLGPPRT